MPIIGLNYTKITVERKASKDWHVEKINTAPKITNVEKSEITGLGSDIGILLVHFAFETTYEPTAGNVTLEGSVIYKAASEKAEKELLTTWKKKKTLPADVNAEVVNHLFRKVPVLSIQLADAVQLPPPFGAPRIKPQES